MAEQPKPHKIAKVLTGEHKEKWLVQGEGGWIDADGKIVAVQASQKHTKWFPGVAEAALDGFKASPAQAAALTKGDKPAPITPTK